MLKYSESFKKNVLNYSLYHTQVDTANYFNITRTTIWKWLNPNLWKQNIKRYKSKYRKHLAEMAIEYRRNNPDILSTWRKNNKEHIRLYRIKLYGPCGRSPSQKWRLSKRACNWRDQIYQKGNYKCQECGAYGILNAHHIKPAKDYPEFRYDINNGVCLCVKCHKMKHSRAPIFPAHTPSHQHQRFRCTQTSP